MLRALALAAPIALVACGASAHGTLAGSVTSSPPPPTPAARAVDPCRTAYVTYEAEWREARTEELAEFAAGDEGVIEEVLFYELATLPKRAEVTRMREIYAVIEAFLWTAPWPRALAAAETAIERCGEGIPRPRRE